MLSIVVNSELEGELGRGGVGVGKGRALSTFDDFRAKSPCRRWFVELSTLVLFLVGEDTDPRGILFSEITVSSIPLGVPTFLSVESF
jgi:hypothetical protein